MRARLRVLFCRHDWRVHLCQPPKGVPSLVICERCDLVMARYTEGSDR